MYPPEERFEDLAKLAKWDQKVVDAQAAVNDGEAHMKGIDPAGWSTEFMDAKKGDFDSTFAHLAYVEKWRDRKYKRYAEKWGVALKKGTAAQELARARPQRLTNGVLLLKQLVREVVIAGEVDTADMYADYRPEDPLAYLGMVMGVGDDAGGGGGSPAGAGGDGADEVEHDDDDVKAGE